MKFSINDVTSSAWNRCTGVISCSGKALLRRSYVRLHHIKGSTRDSLDQKQIRNHRFFCKLPIWCYKKISVEKEVAWKRILTLKRRLKPVEVFEGVNNRECLRTTSTSSCLYNTRPNIGRISNLLSNCTKQSTNNVRIE